jgi:hypothetical protein
MQPNALLLRLNFDSQKVSVTILQALQEFCDTPGGIQGFGHR